MKKEYIAPPVCEVVDINADNLVLMVSGNSSNMDVEDKDVLWS